MELITDFDGDLKQNRSRHGMIENFAKLTLQSIKESNNKAADPPNLIGLHLSTAKVMLIIRSINFTKIHTKNQFDFRSNTTHRKQGDVVHSASNHVYYPR